MQSREGQTVRLVIRWHWALDWATLGIGYWVSLHFVCRYTGIGHCVDTLGTVNWAVDWTTLGRDTSAFIVSLAHCCPGPWFESSFSDLNIVVKSKRKLLLFSWRWMSKTLQSVFIWIANTEFLIYSFWCIDIFKNHPPKMVFSLCTFPLKTSDFICQRISAATLFAES